MSVAALVCDASQARTVITWSARFAMAKNTDLVIYYLTNVAAFRQTKISIDGEERFADPTREAIQQAIEDVVRTRHARKGRIGRYQVTVRHITAPDPVSVMIQRIRVETPLLFVGSCEKSSNDINQLAVSRQVATRIACDSVILYTNEDSSDATKNITAALSGGRSDLESLRLAVESASTIDGTVFAVSLDSASETGDTKSGEKSLSKSLAELQLIESDSFQTHSIHSGDPAIELADASREQDLILLGSDSEKSVTKLLASTDKPMVGVFRRAPRLATEHGWVRALSLLPRINPADYADLYEKLQSGSRWNADFIVMLSLATAIATLGLLQSSPAVVIGSMLLAPLMTPMIGMGLALNRGNGKLAYACFRAIGRGFLASLLISSVIGYVTPGSDLTPEIFARTEPNILDLLIAIFSGMAASYALARPGLAGSIAGVAIATALVPPLCSAGIALSYGEYVASIGAAWLLAANILAIILSAALTFRAMGLSDFNAIAPRSLWVSRVIIGLVVCSIVVGLPLIQSFFEQVKRGEPAPMAMMVTNDTRSAVVEKIEEDPGVTLLLIGRPGIPRRFDPVDVGVIISSDHPLPKSYGDEIADVVRDSMGNPNLRVLVECVSKGWQ